MGFSLIRNIGTKKDPVRSTDVVNENSLNEELRIENSTSIEEDNRDMQKNSSKKSVKKYIYVAFDKSTGEVAKDRNGNLIFSCQVENTSSIEWINVEGVDESKLIYKDAFKTEVKKHKDSSKARKAAKKVLEKMVMESATQKEDNESQTITEDAEKKSGVITENMSEGTTLNANRINDTKDVNGNDTVKQTKKQNPNEIKSADEKENALEAITKVVTDAEKRLNKDINDLIDDLSDTIGQNGNEILGEAKIVVEAGKKEVESIVQKTANDAANYTIRQIKGNVQTNNETIISTVKAESRIIRESQEKATKKLSRIEDSVKEWQEYDEEVLGRLSKVDELAQVLSDKGVTISQEIPPINADEEDIVNLVRYSQKITEQLGFAARELIRKREVFESQKQGNENEQKIIEQKVQVAHDKGVDEGKLVVIKELLSAFDGVDGIKDSDNNYLKAIWNKLKELGVEIDGDDYYEKGNEIELPDVDIEKMMAMYPGLEGAGRYKVIKTGLVFRKEIIVKAEFKKIEESVEGKDDNLSENEKEKKCDINSEENTDMPNEERKEENNNTQD